MPSVSLQIETPPEIAWRLLTDTHEWPVWGPSVRAVRAPARHIAPGMTGHIQTPMGLWLPFRITDWEDGLSWAWRVAGLAATGHRVTPLGQAQCRVSFLIPGWAPLYRPVCETALRRIAARAATLSRESAPDDSVSH
jgi:hypothetical protein